MREKYVLLKKQTLDSAETIDFANFKDFVYGYTAPVIEKLRKGLKQKGFEAIAEADPQTVDSTLIRTV